MTLRTSVAIASCFLCMFACSIMCNPESTPFTTTTTITTTTTTTTASKTLTSYAIFGDSGVGKSTIGNCLLTASGELDKLQRAAFATSDDVAALTRSLQLSIDVNETVVVADTPGLDQLDERQVRPFVRDVSDALARLTDRPRVDWIVFVVSRGQPLERVLKLFRRVQDELTGVVNNRGYNSLLVVTRCEKGWLNKPRQQANQRIQELLRLVDQRVVEIDFKWNHASDDDAMRAHNTLVRQQAVDEFHAALASFTFDSRQRQMRAELKLRSNETQAVNIAALQATMLGNGLLFFLGTLSLLAKHVCVPCAVCLFG